MCACLSGGVTPCISAAMCLCECVSLSACVSSSGGNRGALGRGTGRRGGRIRLPSLGYRQAFLAPRKSHLLLQDCC